MRLPCLAALLLSAFLAMPALAQRPHAASPPAGPPTAGAERTVVVRNAGRQVAAEVHVSSSATDDWGQNRAAAGGLKPGGSLRVRLGRGSDCEFDVLVVYADGSQEESDDVDACHARQLAFDGSTATGGPGGDGRQTPHQVTVANATPRDVVEVYLSAPGAPRWGDDQLGDDTLAAGESTTLVYVGGCTVDVRVVYDNKAAEERRGVDICAGDTLALAPGWVTRGEDDGDAPETAPVAGPAAAPAAAAGAGLDVTNAGARVISELYLFPDGAREHGDDLLGAAALKPGETQTLDVAPGRFCRSTALALFQGGGSDTRSGIDLCGVRQLAIGAAS